LFGLAAVGALASAGIRTGHGSGLIPIALLLAGTGVLSAAIFAVAAGEAVDQRALVSPLYAADVLGGAIGSVVASLMLIPLLGLVLASEWAVAFAAVGIVLSVAANRQA
jgi:hypothetical protein